MDTVASPISVADLAARLGSPGWPIVLDVRRQPAYERDTETLPALLRCPPEDVDAFAASLPPGAEVVVYCVHGHEVSQGAARDAARARLRRPLSSTAASSTGARAAARCSASTPRSASRAPRRRAG